MARRGVSAWLVSWEVRPVGLLPVAEDGEVVAVLPARWREKRVNDVVQRLYNERTLTLAEQVLWRHEDKAPYKPTPATYVHGVPVADYSVECGHNPVLRATRVERLRALSEDSLEWVEVAPVHSVLVCQATGHPDCELADAEPKRTVHRWPRNTARSNRQEVIRTRHRGAT